MARSFINTHRFLCTGIVTLLAAGGCYYDNFEKVTELSGSTGGTSSSGGNDMGGSGPGGETGSGGNMTVSDVALAVTDEFFTRQGDALTEELFLNDGGPGLTATGSDDSDPERPTSLDAANFDVSDAGVLRFTPHDDFWGTYRATYDIEDENGETSTGDIIIHVIPDEISLATIDAGWGGIVIDGDTDDELGFSVDGINDFNGDGNNDLLIGAPGADGGNGRVAVIFGGEDLTDLDLSDTNDNVQFYVGDGTNDRAGESVSKAGNLNGDLFQDIIVGAPGGPQGRAYVIYGLGNAAGADKPFKDAPTAIEGFTLFGTPGDQAGRFVTGGEDIDGDGTSDVLVFSQAGTGTFYADFDTTTGTLGTETDREFSSNLPASPRAALLGDLFGLDGESELLVPAAQTISETVVALLSGQHAMDNWPADATGASDETWWKTTDFATPTVPLSMTGAGEFDGDVGIDFAYCNSASVCRVLTDNELPGYDLDVGRVINGFASAPRVAGGGNVNNDGFDDLVFAEGTAAYVLWGTETPPTADLDIADLDEEGFKLDPDGETIAEVAIVGDVNDDNIDDFAVTMPTFDGNKGRVYIVFGTITE